MRNIKLTLAYDGGDFRGWQIQKEARTVQGEVEKALGRMHQSDIRVNAAGRTDAGVHARGQVVNFLSHLDGVGLGDFPRAVGSFLPGDVSALRAEAVDEGFHARYWARRRRYVYYIFASPVRVPHFRRYSMWLGRLPDIARLNRMAAVLLGEHDFTSFSKPGAQVKNYVCRVLSAGFYPSGDFIVFHITALSFLWKMVRSIVGSLLEFEQKGYTAEDVRAVLLARDRSLAGMTARSCGLFLDRVEYGALKE